MLTLPGPPSSSPVPPLEGSPRSHDSASSDADLVARVRAGDECAMNELLRVHWSRVVDYVERLTQSRDLGQDIAQEVFLRLWQRSLMWRGSGSLQSFLLGAARNLTRNQKRRWREVRVDSFESHAIPSYAHDSPTPADHLRECEVELMFRAAVAALPPRRQEVFILARVHGLSHQEIAETMEISVQTVANQMSQALTELRRNLAPVFED